MLALPFTNALPQEEDGKVAFNSNCRTCHSMDEGDHRLGPSLHDIVGREAGSSEGYGFSRAMKESKVVWNAETLDRFIRNPNGVIPGNNMKPYGGISDAKLRARIVSYLSEASSEDAEGRGRE